MDLQKLIEQEREAFACEISKPQGADKIRVEWWTYVDGDSFAAAQRVADGRLRALNALETVLALATAERDKIRRTYVEQPNTAYAGYANAMDDVIHTIESKLRGES